MEKQPSRFELVELFMAKWRDDWNRCFHGTIRRETVDGNPIYMAKLRSMRDISLPKPILSGNWERNLMS